ncbi:MAG: CopD family protein [Amaricoccus sp.]
MRRLAAAVLLAAVLAAGDASAHAQLVATDPPAGAVVPTAPAAVTLTFSEPVGPLAVRWFPPAGDPVEVVPTARGARLLVPVPAAAGRGTQVVSWRVVSADGHPVGASYSFSIGAATTAVAAPAAPSAWPAALGRGLLTLALVFGVGGAVAVRLLGPAPRAQRLASVAALAAPALALLASGLQGIDLLGVPPGALVTAAPWRSVLASPFAGSAAAAAAAGLLAAAALRRRGLVLAVLAWACAALSFALFGHAADAPPRWLAAPAVAMHAAAFVFWIGALPCLAERTRARALLPALRRFSRIAVPLVAGLVASGATLALLELRHPSDLLDTPYGRLLAAKLALVLPLLALAALNRLRLTPAIARGAPHAPEGLRRSIAAELVLAVAILALASGFRLTPPPRALDLRPLEIPAHLHGRTAMAMATLSPGRPGPNTVAIAIMGADGEPLDPLGVTVALADPGRGVEPLRMEAVRDGDGWRAGPFPLPHAGRWDLTVRVLVSDFAEETLGATVTLP